MDEAKASLVTLINRVLDGIQNFVWELGAKHVSNFYNLRNNLRKLKDVIDDLEAYKKDLDEKITGLENKSGGKRLHIVSLWFNRVEDLSKEGNDLLEEGKKHLGRLWPGGIWSETCLATTGFGGDVDACLKELLKQKTVKHEELVGDARQQQQQQLQGDGQQQDGTAYQKLSRRNSFNSLPAGPSQASIEFRDDTELHRNSFPGSVHACHHQNQEEQEPENDLRRTENDAAVDTSPSPAHQPLNNSPQPVSEVSSADNIEALTKLPAPKVVDFRPSPPPLPFKKSGTEETPPPLPPSPPPNGDRPLKPLDEKQLDSKNQDGPPLESLTEKQQEKQDPLIKCLYVNQKFSKGRPITACYMYKYLLQLGLFEVAETTIFESIIQEIHSIVKVQDLHILSYWLSNTSTLLLLVHHRIKPSSVQLLEATKPVEDFEKRLEDLVIEIYGKIRGNLKKNISPFFEPCIKASQGDSPWKNIKKALEDCSGKMKKNCVHPFLARKLFSQIFLFINEDLFKRLLLLPGNFAFFFVVKSKFDVLQEWCNRETDEFVGSAWDELKPIRQAIKFLAIAFKSQMTLQSIREEHCPDLSIRQLYKICTMFGDDKFGSKVSSEVISSLKKEMEDSNDDYYSSEDDDSVPFAMEEFYKSIKKVDVSDIKPPPLIYPEKQNPPPLISELY